MSVEPISEKAVLVLGHGSRAFLAVIRSLGRIGLNVHVAMCDLDDLALRSRYVRQRHEIRRDHWLEDMIALLSRVEFALVLPCGDESMHPVQVHQNDLRRYAPVYAYTDQIYQIAFNKYESTRLAIEHGIPVPPQIEITGDTTPEDITRAISLPLVLKPPSSIDENDPNRRREVVRVRTPSELAATLPEFRQFKSGAVAQENFVGIGVGVEILAQDGVVLIAFQHQRVHEPVEGGGSSYRCSVELNEALRSATENLMRALEYTGVAMVEFKFNRTTGEWIFIEINGRFWGSLPLAIASGVDFPAYLMRMRAGEPLGYSGSYRIGIHSRSLLDDYHWFANNMRANHDDPTQATVPLAKILAEVLNVFRGVERIDTFASDDMRPGLIEIQRLLKRIVLKVSDSIHRTLIPTFFLQRRKARVQEKFLQANNVGFVCYGNICRSPFAREYAQRRFPNVTIWSGGFHDKKDRKVPSIGVTVARQMDVELEDARSTVITRAQVDEADLILVFDEKNMQAMKSNFPEAQGKTHYLADATAAKDREIEDPYGGNEMLFQAIYKKITAAINALSK